MTLAEQLRKEKANTILTDMPWLKESVIRRVRDSGEWSIICDRHVREISENFSAPYKYWAPIEEWARGEGFRVYPRYNSYGVKSICISL